MLFLDILHVSAATSFSSLIKNRIINGTNVHYYDLSLNAFSSVSNDIYRANVHNVSQSLSQVTFYADVTGHGYKAHVKLPYVFQLGASGTEGWQAIFGHSDWNSSDYFAVTCVLQSMIFSWSDGSTSRNVTFSNVSMQDFNGRVFGGYINSNNDPASFTFLRGYDMLTARGTSSAPINISGFLEFDIFISDIADLEGHNISDNLSLNFHPSFTYSLYSLKDEYKSDMGSVSVTDTITQQQLQELNNSTNNIEDSTTNPNGGGILGTIKNFFGGFFNWLKDLLLGLFIPDDDYFSTWFSNLNNLLSAKLGMLYAPFDLLITVLNAVYLSSTDFTGVPFPEIRWGDTVLIGSQNLTFASLLGEHFSEIQGYVYFATDVVLLFAFLMLLQRKISLILRGHESG